MSLYQAFATQFERFKDKPCLIREDNSVLSYQAIAQKSAQIAHFLVQNNVTQGDRLLCVLQKSPDVLCLYLACLRVGMIFVPINPSCTASELQYAMQDINPKFLAIDQQDDATVTDHSSPANVTLFSSKLLASQEITALDTDFDNVPLDGELTAAIIYTSGTTGKPKGAMLSYNNLLANSLALVKSWAFCEHDVLLHALPIYHVHGLFFAHHTALLSGATMIYHDKFDADKALAWLPKATVMMGVPTYYARLNKHPKLNADGCRHVRLFISGSAPLLKDVYQTFFAKTEKPIYERYGMSETGINTVMPIASAPQLRSVGKALPNQLLRIMPSSQATDSRVGEIAVKGPNVFQGYWQSPTKTKEAFTLDGYFKTGDLGYLDNEQYLILCGREKDMVISGGLNIYPIEVENTLNQIDYIDEAAVVGLPDDDFGERLVAVITVKNGARKDCAKDHIIRYCKNALAGYKVPKAIYRIDTMPKNTMGKIQKNLIKEHLAQLEQIH